LEMATRTTMFVIGEMATRTTMFVIGGMISLQAQGEHGLGFFFRVKTNIIRYLLFLF